MKFKFQILMKLFIIFLFLYSILCNLNISYNKKYNKNITNNETYIFQYLRKTKNSNNKKNLILGIIENYSLKAILPFFRSLIRSNFINCDIVIFVRNVSQTVINYLKQINVFVYEISEEYKNVSPINLRWKLYIEYLKERKMKYNLVFCADIRDTIFQKDVFKYYEKNKPFLGVALEDGTLNEKSNKIWIINFAGKEKHEIIQNERIICVGLLWGTVEKFLEFITIFWETLVINTHYVDQGIANYLFYYKKLFSNYILKSDNYGPVMTIGITPPKNIILDSENNILNFKGEIAAVIHQYDRKPDIVKIVIKKYCPEILPTNQIIVNDLKINKTNNNNGNECNNNTKIEQIIKSLKLYKNIISSLIFLEFFTIISSIKIILIIKIKNNNLIRINQN